VVSTKRTCALLAAVVAFTVAVHLGQPQPAGLSRFPLAGLWELITTRPAWSLAPPNVPAQGRGHLRERGWSRRRRRHARPIAQRNSALQKARNYAEKITPVNPVHLGQWRPAPADEESGSGRAAPTRSRSYVRGALHLDRLCWDGAYDVRSLQDPALHLDRLCWDGAYDVRSLQDPALHRLGRPYAPRLRPSRQRRRIVRGPLTDVHVYEFK